MSGRETRPVEAGSATSVYQRVLGDEFALLDPPLQRYFGPIPAHLAGTGTGVYEFAGTTRRFLRPLLRWLAWRWILFPESGRDVPFTVLNTADAGALRATRTFCFPGKVRVMQDSMAVIDGRLVDRLGRRHGLEVDLTPAVHDGGLRLTSGRLRLRLGRLRLALPRMVTMRLDERADPGAPGRQRVDVTVRTPWIGEVFRYHGSFSYELVAR